MMGTRSVVVDMFQTDGQACKKLIGEFLRRFVVSAPKDLPLGNAQTAECCNSDVALCVFYHTYCSNV